MVKIGVSVFMAILIIMGAAYSYGQDKVDEWQVKTARGRVSDKDWVGNLIVIDTGSDTLTIKVMDSTTIMCGIQKETLNEVVIGDNVVVKYYDAGVEGLKAINIDDRNTGNAW